MPKTFEKWTISHSTYDRLHEHDWAKNPHFTLARGTDVTSFSEILTCAENVANYCQIRLMVRFRKGGVTFICTGISPKPPTVEELIQKTFDSPIWSSARGTAKMAARSFVQALEDEGYEIVRKS